MNTPEDQQLIKRAQGLSDAVPFVELLQDLADEVDGWWADGIPEAEIDRQIIKGVHELGFDASAYVAQMPALSHLTDDQKTALVRALRFDEWAVQCVKSIARTGKPIPFIYAIGDVFTDEKTLADENDVLVWAVATRATDPEVVARKFVKVCKRTFGDQVTKEQKPQVRHPGQMTPTEALSMHRQGMSYKEIAIQNLRRTYPDIIQHDYRYRSQIKAERHRLVDEIRTAQRVWEERVGDSPIDE